MTMFYAMVSGQGTACAETGICEHCFDDDNQAYLAARAFGIGIDGPDYDKGFVDVTGNEAISCNICGEGDDE